MCGRGGGRDGGRDGVMGSVGGGGWGAGGGGREGGREGVMGSVTRLTHTVMGSANPHTRRPRAQAAGRACTAPAVCSLAQRAGAAHIIHPQCIHIL